MLSKTYQIETVMRMLAWMMGICRIEKVMTEYIRAKAGVGLSNISQPKLEKRNWNGCDTCRPRESLGRCCSESMEVSGLRNIRRSKLSTLNKIRRRLGNFNRRHTPMCRLPIGNRPKKKRQKIIHDLPGATGYHHK